MKILITGCAGFIGYHLAASLISKKNKIYGLIILIVIIASK